ncbi:MAG: hypothetical protein ACFB12_00135 [Leptolyngbyaceae cyanobacterium]
MAKAEDTSRDRLALTNDVVMVSTADGLKIWDLQTAELVAVLDQEPISQLIVSPDGRQLIGLADDGANNTQIQIWQRP